MLGLPLYAILISFSILNASDKPQYFRTQWPIRKGGSYIVREQIVQAIGLRYFLASGILEKLTKETRISLTGQLKSCGFVLVLRIQKELFKLTWPTMNIISPERHAGINHVHELLENWKMRKLSRKRKLKNSERQKVNPGWQMPFLSKAKNGVALRSQPRSHQSRLACYSPLANLRDNRKNRPYLS